MAQTSPRPRINREVLVGSALMVIGLALFAESRTGLDVNLWSSGWAVLLFVMGLIRFIDPRTGDGECPSRRTGAWLMTVGAWGFASANGLFGLSYRNSWPLLIIAAGIITVWWAIDESRRTVPKGGSRW
jgi:hypothetical protein